MPNPNQNKAPATVGEVINQIERNMSEDLTVAGMRRMAALIWSIIPPFIEQLRMEEISQGKLWRSGWNPAVKAINSKIDDMLK